MFVVNVVIVVGSERLYNDMARRFHKDSTTSTSSMVVVKVDKSGGCVDRDGLYLQQMREAQIKQYFFGTPRSQLSPFSQQVGYDEVAIYRVAESMFSHCSSAVS